MRKRWLAVLSACLLHAGIVSAQRPVRLALGGGVSLPQGQFGDVAATGWNALVGLSVSTLMQAWGLRLDAAHNQFGTDVTSGNSTVTSGTLNLTYRLPMTNSPLSPYLVGGAGAYRFGCSGGVTCTNSTRFGWNAGLGTRFTGMHLQGFLEARFNAVKSGGANVRYVPVTLGLML